MTAGSGSRREAAAGGWDWDRLAHGIYQKDGIYDFHHSQASHHSRAIHCDWSYQIPDSLLNLLTGHSGGCPWRGRIPCQGES